MDNSTIILEQIKAASVFTKEHIYFFCKRLVDIVLSLIAVIFLLIFTILVKIIYIASGDMHPIIYKHERIGKNGKTFKLYKFRTMVVNSDEILKQLLKNPKTKKEWQENHKLNNDPRITKIGKFLRKTSIDELPQIINILKGEMAIIGPRPLVRDEVEAYQNNKEKLLSVRPGLTGWWACNGRSDISNKERQKLELYYVDNCCFLFDVKIFFLTIVKVLKKEGAK